MKRQFLTIAAIMLFPTAAHAEWLKAESRHFIVYSKESREQLTERTERLERFDQAVRAVRSMEDPPLPSGAKVSVYVLPSVTDIQELAGSGGVYGFYNSRSTGSVAFVPRKTQEQSRYDLSADQVLFHEYAHHLMYTGLDGWVPRWLVEGFAEFYASPKFEKDGTVVLGQSPAYRSWGIFDAFRPPIDKMMSDDLGKMTGERWESFYGRSWALTHLLTFEPSRQGQLTKYLIALRDGKNGATAASEIFGDLTKLDKEITRYAGRAGLMTLRVPPARIQIGKIDIQSMGPAADTIMPVYVRSRAGVTEKTAAAQAEKMRAAAAGFPNDPLALIALAEAENDAGNEAASITATDKILAANPNHIDALTMKAQSLLNLARKGKDTQANRIAARALAVRANKLAPDDPEPLIEFFDSYEGNSLSPSAIKGLHYALVLAPQDSSLRRTSAALRLHNGELAEARLALLPLAHDPHNQDLAEGARDAIAAIDRKDAKAALAVLQNIKKPDENKDKDGN